MAPKVRIQLRHDTAANWTSANPTLASGEAGFETDTGALKIGDGTTAWNALGYATGGSGAPTGADYLVGTANGGLSAEIVVGTTPGGELGGTWSSPTVDATHSGSAHHDPVTVGTGLDVTGQLVELDLSEVAAGGELGGFMDAPTVDATHSGSAHHTEDHDHDGSPTQKLLQTNTHETPDTDSATSSLHHTIGTSATQAAAGNHGHTGYAPDSVDYLVGTASGGLSGEIAVGTTPGGELGGTWASPTVDATHSGSSHAATQAAAEATAASALSGHTGDTSDAHDASAISFSPAGTISATDVQAAIEEVAAEASGASFATPAIVLGTAAAAGAASTVIRSDSTIVAFDATAPTTQAFGDSAATGSAAVSARRDHKHGMPSSTGTKITALSSATPLTTDVVPYVSDPAGTPVTKKTTVANLLSPITGIDYLVGTASGNLSAEIAVGTTPGGELGGTWASPTVDQDHAGEYSGGGTTFAVDNTNKDILSVALASLAAGDVLTGEAYVLYLNNSGGARTISTILDLGGQSVTVSDGATIGASATNRSTIKLRFSLWIESSSSIHMFIEQLRGGPAAANTPATSAGLSSIRDSWNTSGSNLTGSQTLAVKIVSSAATTTQTAYVMGWRVRRAT